MGTLPPDLRRVVRRALETYLAGTDPREEPFRRMASRHLALPILPDWTGFVGLTEDGRLLWIPEEGPVSDPNGHVRHLALLRAGEIYPELMFLRPEPAADWIECGACHGTGKVMMDGVAVPGVRCLCGDVGRLPPHVSRMLHGGVNG